MTIALPELGPSFTVQPLTAATARTAQAGHGRFTVTPGVYLLNSAGPVDVTSLPAYVGHLGMAEFHAPPTDDLPSSVHPLTAPEFLAGRDAVLRALVADSSPPDSATLFIRAAAGGFYRGYALRPTAGYVYAATIPAGSLQEGPHEFAITLFRADTTVTFPGGQRQKPTDWDYHGRESWSLDMVGPKTPLSLFDPGSDAKRLAFSRIGDAGRRGLFRVGLSPVSGRPVFHLELPEHASGPGGDDYTASLVVTDRIRARQEAIGGAEEVQLRLRGLGSRQVLHVTLMEEDGTSWSRAITVDSGWRERTIPLATFTSARGVLLPQGFPGEWNYWVGPAAERGDKTDRLRIERLERLQLSIRREAGVVVTPGGYGVEVEWVRLGIGAVGREEGRKDGMTGGRKDGKQVGAWTCAPSVIPSFRPSALSWSNRRRTGKQLRCDHEIDNRTGGEQETAGAIRPSTGVRAGVELHRSTPDHRRGDLEHRDHPGMYRSQAMTDRGPDGIDFNREREPVGDLHPSRNVSGRHFATAATRAGSRRQQQPEVEDPPSATHVFLLSAISPL
jgi:hypothetical protein